MQYDAPTETPEVLASLDAHAAIDDQTLTAISAALSLDTAENVNVAFFDTENLVAPPGATPQVVVVAPETSEGGPTEIVLPDELASSASVFVFDTEADLTVTLAATDAVIALGTGDNSLTLEGEANATVAAADGNDTIVTSAGDDSVSTGAGNDTIIATGGNDTIDGGEGFDVVQTSGTIDDVTIEIVDGQLVVTSADQSVTVSNTEFIQLEEGTSIAVAGNETDAVTLSMYQGLLGRSSDVEGAEYWVEDVNSDGRTVVDVANAIMATDEYRSTMGEASDAEFVAALYENALGREATEDEAAYWVNDLAAGQDRASVAVGIIGSAEASEHIVNVQILDGLV